MFTDKLQIASAAGATVIATSSTDEKLQVARKLGAKHLINYRKTPNQADEILKFTDGKGVDLVVDVVGSQTIEQMVKATRYAGAIVILGLLSEDPNLKVNIMQDILYGNKSITGHLGAGNREHGRALAALMEEHQLHPPIAEVFKFEEADKAIEAIKKLSAPGKVVVKV
jgi:NADPH:quinone reductase-like Zn-dependent oxidoreductase